MSQLQRDVRDCPKCGAKKGVACRHMGCVQLQPVPLCKDGKTAAECAQTACEPKFESMP